jgi:hypothetical protein
VRKTVGPNDQVGGCYDQKAAAAATICARFSAWKELTNSQLHRKCGNEYAERPLRAGAVRRMVSGECVGQSPTWEKHQTISFAGNRQTNGL